ncbi:unnamed protein product [Calypogeia fissa]
MLAPITLPGVVQQSRLSGPCFSTSLRSSSGGCLVRNRTAVTLRSMIERIDGCSCSNEAGSDWDATSRIGHPPGNRASFLFTGSSRSSIHSTKLFDSRVPRGGSKSACWRSARNFWKQTVNQVPSLSFEKCLDAVKKLTLQLLKHDADNRVSQEEGSNANSQRSGSTLSAIVVSLIVLTAPGPTLTNSTVTLSDTARADQLGQLRQAASILEKAAESLPKVRFDGTAGLQVLDKAVTVVTGSIFVDPKVLDEEVDGLLSGKKDIQQEVQNGIRSAAEHLTSTVYDILINFNPSSLSESAGASISAFLEGGAERIAAFELSALVSLGERWLILTPLLVLPMAWEMNRLKAKNERELREGQEMFEELSGEAMLRGEKVRRELERIELRTSLLEAVTSLGKAALEPPRSREDSGLTRRRIKEILERLQDLNPVEESLLLVPEFASTLASSTTPYDALSYVPTSPTVDGDWHLIYVSETTDASGPQERPQFPGFGLDNLRQKVWQASSIKSLTPDNNIPSPSPLLARNTAEVRLGPLGVFQVAVEGSWENLKDGQRALVSFNTFSARPVEILGNKLSDDMPQFSLSLPPPLQRSAEWAVAYVDDHLRINRGSRGQLYLFRKIE